VTVAAKRKIDLLSITGESCWICHQNEPWSYRVRLEEYGAERISGHENICANCIRTLSLDHFTEIYDTLLQRRIYPGDI